MLKDIPAHGRQEAQLLLRYPIVLRTTH